MLGLLFSLVALQASPSVEPVLIRLSLQGELPAGCALRPRLEEALTPGARLVEQSAAFEAALTASDGGLSLEVSRGGELLSRRALPPPEPGCAHLAQTLAAVLERSFRPVDPAQELPSLAEAIPHRARFGVGVAGAALVSTSAALPAGQLELSYERDTAAGRLRFALGGVLAGERGLPIVEGDGAQVGAIHARPLWGYVSGAYCLGPRAVSVCAGPLLALRGEAVWSTGALRKQTDRWLWLPAAGAAVRVGLKLPAGFEVALAPQVAVPLGSAGVYVSGTDAQLTTPSFEVAGSLQVAWRIP